MKTLKHFILSTALAGMFLSAGAFAKSEITTTAGMSPINVTVIYKTSVYPRIILIRSCAAVKCVEA
jgi:formate/nitrite transporter FocA (FNT family)